MKRVIRAALEALCLLVLLGTYAHLALNWKDLPERVPTNYDFAGHVTGYGGRGTLLILSAAMLALYVTFSLMRTVRLRSWGKVRRLPASREMLLMVTIPAAISGTSISNRRLTRLG